jgi:hypothetical protein
MLYGSLEEHQNLCSCCQSRLYLENNYNGLVNVKLPGCNIPVLNRYYCKADQLRIATSALLACVNREGTNADSVDIGTAIQLYSDYCNEVLAKDLVVTSTAESPTISKSNPFIEYLNPFTSCGLNTINNP